MVISADGGSRSTRFSMKSFYVDFFIFFVASDIIFRLRIPAVLGQSLECKKTMQNEYLCHINCFTCHM